MPRTLPLLLALLLALLLGGSAGAVTLCRVTADSRPAWWGATLRTITVRLVPACPPEGVAYVHLGGYGGPGSKKVGPAARLDAARPVLKFSGQPQWRTVLWEAANKKLYQVRIPQEVIRGESTPED